MDGKKFDKNTLKTLVIAASLLLNCVLGGASYTYYHHLAEQMNETASLQSQVSHLEGSVSDLQAQVDESQPTIDNLKAQVASLTEEKNGLQTQVDTLTSQKADLQKQVDTLKAGASSGSSSGGSSSNLAVISGESNRNTSSETEFADMAGFEWANDAVKQLKAWGVIDGVGDNNYAPARNVTREEFTKLIVSAFDIDGNSAEPSYSDADKNAWYYSSIKAAYSNKIVNGISDELFGVGEYISRQDAACILFRMLNLKGIEQTVGECGFSDSSDIAGYAYDAVSALWKSGLISGKGNGDFCPDDNLNRAEAAKLIYNICVYIGR